MNQLFLSNRLKYVFSKYPVLSTIFFSSTKTQQNMLVLRKLTSPLREMKVAKSHWSKFSFYLYKQASMCLHAYQKKKKRKSFPEIFLCRYLTSILFLSHNFGATYTKERQGERKRILIAFGFWNVYLVQVKERQFWLFFIFLYKGSHRLFVEEKKHPWSP